MFNFKKVVSLFLCLAMLVCMLASCDKGIQKQKPQDDQDNEDSKTDTELDTLSPEVQGTEGLEYFPLSDDTYGVSAGTAKYLQEIVIPATHNGKAVTQILEEAFFYAYAKTITIPNSVTDIGSSAFSGCTSLTSIVIGNGVTTIGKSAFSMCTSLTSITIPNSVTSIGNSAFGRCTSLTSIVIPNSVTNIGDHAFSGCTKLTSIVIGNGITTIGDSVFQECHSLTSIVIPESITTIGNFAFSACKSLTSITIPHGVTTIGNFVFYYCPNLTSIIIPDRVTTIGDHAFSDCAKLTDVYYCGTAVDWDSIAIHESNPGLTRSTHYYYSETAPTDTTNKYWHWVDGIPTVWEVSAS